MSLTADQKAAEKAAERHRKEVEAALLAALLLLRSRMVLAVWWLPDTWRDFADMAGRAIDPVFAAHDEAAKSVWLGFDSLDTQTLEAERRYKEKFTQEFSDATRRAVEIIVAWGQTNGIADEQLTAIIESLSGLNANQTGPILVKWLEASEGGASSTALKTILDEAAKTALKQRVKTVAGDALWAAVQMGQMAAGKQEQRATNASVVKRWVTAGDELVCSVCGALDGQTVQIGEFFPGGLMMPPAHSHCRCMTEISTKD